MPAGPVPWFPVETPAYMPWQDWSLKSAAERTCRYPGPVDKRRNPAAHPWLELEIVPGIPALAAGAALAGAPLTHDFASCFIK
ncbi:MAG: hypothetical protein U5K27_02695 [Desulfotignum sp.]|nr:hypothetical protein [Desulfotignum sp.]